MEYSSDTTIAETSTNIVSEEKDTGRSTVVSSAMKTTRTVTDAVHSRSTGRKTTIMTTAANGKSLFTFTNKRLPIDF